MSKRGLDAADLQGTLPYTAPEKNPDSIYELSCKTDIFSIGSILVRVLTGEPAVPRDLPTVEKIRRICDGDYNEVSQRLQAARKTLGIPKELVKLTLDCLEIVPQARPDAGVVAKRINDYFRSEEEELSQLKIKNVKRKYVFVAGVALLIMSIGWSIWAYRDKQIIQAAELRTKQSAASNVKTIAEVVRTASSDKFRKYGQTSLQKELLEAILPRIEEVSQIESVDDSSKFQKALALNALAYFYDSDHKYSKALDSAKVCRTTVHGTCGRWLSTRNFQVFPRNLFKSASCFVGETGRFA